MAFISDEDALFVAYVTDLVSRSLGQQQLPEEYYEVLVRAALECQRDLRFTGDDYREYVIAVAEGIVGYTRALLPYVPHGESFLKVPLRAFLGATTSGDVMHALGGPFRRGGPSSHPFMNRARDDKHNIYDGWMPYWREDESEGKEVNRLHREFNKHNEKVEQDHQKAIGGNRYNEEIALRRTPYYPHLGEIQELFDAPAPLVLEETKRFEHMWIVAKHGSGKTNLLKNFIAHDMEKQASVVVIDSQNELIPEIVSIVPPERLVYLEPDIEHPLALNLFDMGDSHQAKEMISFVLAGLLKGVLTAKQEGVFRSLMEAMAVIPGATIETMKELFTKEGYERYRPYFSKLPPYTQRFFERDFIDSDFVPTKKEIGWRLHTILSDPLFYAMFTHPKNRFDMGAALQAGKVICINTDLAHLGAKGTEIFGRFFLALIVLAGQQRLLLNRSKRLPTYVFLDEAHQYIADEPLVSGLIDEARKQRIAFTFAHQRTAQITNAGVRDALEHCYFKLTPELDYRFALTAGARTYVVSTDVSPLEAEPTAMARARRAMVEAHCAPPKVQELEDEPEEEEEEPELIRPAPTAVAPPPSAPRPPKPEPRRRAKGSVNIDPVKE